MDPTHHQEFILKTDRKNLRSQLKYLVDTAMKAYRDDLAEMRRKEQEIEEEKERQYEDEYTQKVKMRVDENVKKRQQNLLDIKLQREKEVEEFVRVKKIQQNINNCVDIREAMRKKNLMEIQTCQLAQMEERRQKELAEKAEDQFWFEVQRVIWANTDKKQEFEDCLKHRLTHYTNGILKTQSADLRQQERDLELIAMQEKSRQMEDHQAEREAQKKQKGVENELRAREYRRQLCQIIGQQNDIDRERQDFDVKFNEAVREQMAREAKKIDLSKRDFKVATLQYLSHVRKSRHAMRSQLKTIEDSIDLCNKKLQCERLAKEKIAKEILREEAVKAHEKLMQQICEKRERDLGELMENLEKDINKSLLLKERPPFDYKEHCAKKRKEYEDELEEIRRYKLAERELFLGDLQKADDETNHCRGLAEKYIKDNIDYLPVHPNWQLISCECK